MSTEQIVAVLIEERDRLNRAIEILGGAVKKRRGRPPGKKSATVEAAAVPIPIPPQASPAPRKKRKLSAAARKKISDAQKKRWAATKQ